MGYLPNLIIPNDLHYSPANKWRQLFLRICKLSMQSANHLAAPLSQLENAQQALNAQKSPECSRCVRKGACFATKPGGCGGFFFRAGKGPAPPMGSIQSRGSRATVSREAPVARPRVVLIAHCERGS